MVGQELNSKYFNIFLQKYTVTKPKVESFFETWDRLKVRTDKFEFFFRGLFWISFERGRGQLTFLSWFQNKAKLDDFRKNNLKKYNVLYQNLLRMITEKPFPDILVF